MPARRLCVAAEHVGVVQQGGGQIVEIPDLLQLAGQPFDQRLALHVRACRALENGRQKDERETGRQDFVVRPQRGKVEFEFGLRRIEHAQLLDKTVAGEKLPVFRAARVEVASDMVRVAERRGGKQQAHPFMQR